MDHRKRWLKMPADIDCTYRQPSMACDSVALLVKGRNPSSTAHRATDRPTGLNRKLIAVEAVRTSLGPPLGGAWVVLFWVVLDR